MAGIGFELKKLFDGDALAVTDRKAVVYSSIVSLGPWVITTITLGFLTFMGKIYLPLRSDRNLFMIAIIYSFVFSQICIGPFQYLIARFLSDKIYSDNFDEIKGAFIGGIRIIFILTFLIGCIFMRSSTLPPHFKFVSILLFSVTAMTWFTMIFTGILKNDNYSSRFVIIPYLIGNVIAVILGISFFNFDIFEKLRFFPSFPFLLAYAIGMVITFFLISTYFMSILRSGKTSEYSFLNYYNGYCSLGIIGALFAVGVWAHIGINWLSKDTFLIGDTFLSSPFYEVVVFYSYILALPIAIYFFIFLETKFFNFYIKYYHSLNGHGNTEEIEKKRKKLVEVVNTKMLHCIEIQFFIALSFAFLADVIFVNVGLDLYYLDLFRIMVFGVSCAIFVALHLVLLLYFDARREALNLSIIFSVLNIVLAFFSFKLGPNYSGTGYFLANFISLIYAKIFLDKALLKINFQSFYHQNFKVTIGSSFLKRLEYFFNKKIYILAALIILFLI